MSTDNILATSLGNICLEGYEHTYIEWLQYMCGECVQKTTNGRYLHRQAQSDQLTHETSDHLEAAIQVWDLLQKKLKPFKI